MSGRNVFIVGVGFIGWNVADLLVSEGYAVAGLVRRKEHAAALEAAHVQPVLGDLHDHELIAGHVAASDVVFHTATADDLFSVQAVLDGVRRRAEAGQPIIYIHTSGTGVLDDCADGEFKSDKIYYDDRPEDIDALPDYKPHRPVDLAIVRAQREIGDKAKIAIMIPPEIYGYVAEHDRLTIQVPTLARFALKHGYAGHVGKGLAVESQIHVKDLARGYITLLHAMKSHPASFVLSNPYFFCENGQEFSWLEVAQEVGKSLHAAGRIDSAEPKTFPREAYGELFGDATPNVIGLNSRSRAVRLRELGWAPREKGIWQSWNEDELPALLKRDNRGFKGYEP